MASLKAELLRKLRTIEGVEDRPSPVAGGTALFWRDRSFAHFHNDNELDLRLTKKLIKAQGLTHPEGSVHHANRAVGSAWIELRFRDTAAVDRICDLVRLAIAELPA